MNLANVEDLYPLSPIQEGLLFHMLYAPTQGFYVQQACTLLKGYPDIDALRMAWQAAIDRHPILRTEFVWEQLSQPLQLVRKAVDLPWEEQDWRDMDTAAQPRALNAYLERDRARGFDPRRAPLVRLHLIRLSSGACQLLFVYHHALLDGWSTPLLLKDVFTAYEAVRSGTLPVFPARRPYRDFIEWMIRRDRSQEEKFWRNLMGGVKSPSLLAMCANGEPGSATGADKVESTELSPEDTAALLSFGRSERLTPSALVMAAWSLVLSRALCERDVVFGVTLSGRSADIPGIETMIGVFMNTLPMRIRIRPDCPLLTWLQEVQRQLVQIREYEYTSLADVQVWSGSARHAALFDTTVVFENYPFDSTVYDQGAALGIRSSMVRERIHYSVSVMAIGGGPKLRLRMLYDAARLAQGMPQALLEDLRAVLTGLTTASPASLIGDVYKILNKQNGRKPMRPLITPATVGFKTARPVARKVGREEIVKKSPLFDGGSMPLLVEPRIQNCDLADWTGANRDAVSESLQRHRALLFRGFDVGTSAEFERVALGVCSSLSEDNGEHPRHHAGGKVYSTVFSPPEKELLWHNENSFNLTAPAKILFWCLKPADEGGESVLVDSARVFAGIDASVRQRFTSKGVMYIRNYGTGVDLPWQAVFGTEDRGVVEERCLREKTAFEWKTGGRLRTWCVRPAVVTHPVTGEQCWFNQAQHWHLACLPLDARRALEKTCAEEDLPRNCCYGDGTPIPDEEMNHICDVYRRLEVSIPLLKTDVLVIDNLLAAHGRKPFRGERRVLAALGDMGAYN
jgi:alpha-ketoglutarate-dependent taurine dioxygenase